MLFLRVVAQPQFFIINGAQNLHVMVSGLIKMVIMWTYDLVIKWK